MPQPPNDDESWKVTAILFAMSTLFASIYFVHSTNLLFNSTRRYCADRFTVKAHEVYWECSKQNRNLCERLPIPQILINN